MRRSLRWSLALALLVGCSSSTGPNSTPDETGSALFRITWPAAARLVPDVAGSLTVRINGSSGQVAEPQTVARPAAGGASTLSFGELPASVALTATANLYPSADGSGTAVATAAVALNIAADGTSTVDLDASPNVPRSTVESFSIAPGAPVLTLGEQTTLVATARNGDGAVLMLPAVEWRIVSGTSIRLENSRQATSHAVDAVAVAEGATTVEARVEQQAGETDSALIAGATVTVGSNIPGPSGNGLLSGRVFDQHNQPLDGVAVAQVGGSASATSNADGYFALGELPAGDLVLSLTRDGFVDQMRPVTVVAGVGNRLAVHLRALGATQAVDPTVANTVSDNGGAVILPAGSVVNSRGRQVAAEMIRVTVTTLRPSDVRYLDTFPGAFAGLRAASRQAGEVPLESFGVVDVRLRSLAGAELSLAAGATAEVLWPIDAANDPGDQVVPIWTLDQETGVWHEEGFAIRDAANGVYRGEVSHFSPWNLDRPLDQLATKQVQILVSELPVFGVPCRVRGAGWAFDGTTDETGTASIMVPADEAADVLYLDADNQWIVAETQELMPPAGQVKVNRFEFDEGSNLAPNLFTVHLTWGEQPEDLDSNLTVPPNPPHRTTRYQVWFAREGSLTGDPFAKLDTDDTTGFGPEIISARRGLPGVYRYTVHRFSDDGTLEASGAKVTLLLGDGSVRTFQPPAQNPAGARYWAVFEVEVDAGGNLAALRELNVYGGEELLLADGGSRTSRK